MLIELMLGIPLLLVSGMEVALLVRMEIPFLQLLLETKVEEPK